MKRSVELLSLSHDASLSHDDQGRGTRRRTDTLDLLAAVHCPSRLQLLALLATGPASVTELVAKTELSMQLVSSHLNKLKALGVLSCDTEGRQRVYRLTSSGSVRHGREGLELDLSALDGSTLRLGIPEDSPVSRLIRGINNTEPKPVARPLSAKPSIAPRAEPHGKQMRTAVLDSPTIAANTVASIMR